MKSSRLHSTHVFASTGNRTKLCDRYQYIRKQEKSTDTQALTVKAQKLIVTICHEMKHKSTDTQALTVKAQKLIVTICHEMKHKSTDTQALTVKAQKLIVTICHEMKHISTDGYSSPENKTKQSTDRRILAAHKQKSTEAGNKSLLACALKKGTKQNGVPTDIVYQRTKEFH